MANQFYTRAARDILKGDLDLDEAGDDIRVMLCMTNTTADSAFSSANVGDLTLDEHDGANYVRKALGTQAVNEDTGNERAEFDAVDVTWTSLGAGTRAIAGALIYKHVTNDADSVPVAWIDNPAFPNSNGGDYTIQWNAEGVVQGQC